MQQLRPLTDVELEYVAAIKRLVGKRGKFGIGDAAAEVARGRSKRGKPEVTVSRSAASKIVNRLAERGEIILGPHFPGCVRAISLPKPKPARRSARRT